MTLPDIPQAGSATRPSRARRLPAWLVLLAVCVGLPPLLLGALGLARRVVEADHHVFLRHVHLGQTEAQIERRCGPARQSWAWDQRDDLGHWLGPDQTYRSSVYYHSYRALAGRRPQRFSHVSVWSTRLARGEFVFFDERGQAVCILSGSS